nr:putative ribonuclease H-like domain-containing protein [Tanacetum cinerariifolium]
MAQPQRQADVHQDELCPPNKCYALKDANKKIDLDNLLCPNESKIITNILQNHPLRFSIAASSSVPWIYLGKFWHTLKDDGSNHERFVASLKFSEMVPFFLNDLGFTLELRSPSNFKTTGYAELLWEGLHYSLKHPSTLIPYPRFTKLIMRHYMTAYPEISKRVRDKYHNLKHDEMVKSIFNSRKNKAGVGMKIPSWMITDEMKLTENYKMTTSALRSPNPNVNEGESSTQRKSTVISLRIPPRCIAKQKIRDDLEAEKNVEKVKEHLVAEEIEKMVEGTKSGDENEADNSILNSQNDPGTRLDPESYKESLEVEKTAVVQPVNVIEKEDESAKDDYELRRRSGHNVKSYFSCSSNSSQQASTQKQQYQLYLTMKDNPQLQHDDLLIWLALKIKFEGINASNTPCRSFTIRLRDQDDPHDDAHPKGIIVKRGRRHLRMEPMKAEFFLTSSFPPKPTLVVQSYQKDPKAHALSLVNQDLLYLKKGNSGLEKFVLSLHKFSAVIFPGDDIEERIHPDGKAFRVFNSRTRIMEDNLHIRFSESTPNVVGTKASDNVGQARKETEPVKDYILLPLWTADLPFSQDPKSSQDDGFKPSNDDGKKVDENPSKGNECYDQEKEDNVNITNNVNTVSLTVNATGTNEDNELSFDPNMPALEDVSIFNFSNDDDIVAESKFVSTIQQRKNHKDLQNCLFACFSSQKEPQKVIRALKDPSWIKAMQEELLQFKLQEVWTLVDLPNGKRAIGTKWIFRNKKDEREIMIRNKARLVAQGHTQEEGIDYDEVFSPVARIKAIRLFLAYASFKDFVVYQMDVKSVFLYRKIEEEVYVCQPPGFEDPDFSDRVYKVKKALYGLHQAPRAWYETLSTYLLDNGFRRGKIDKPLFIKRHKGDILLVQVYVDDIIFGSTRKELCNTFERLMHEKFQMSSMGELTFFLGLQVKQKKDGIFISQDKYVAEILKKFGFTEVKNASTPMETQKPLLKDEYGEELDVYMYRSMISSLMYLTSSRPDIMFAVCACARYQVNLKVSHLHAMKRIFRVDGKKVIISEASIRRDLQFADEEGVDCLPNSIIIEQLASMGGIGKGFSGRITSLFPTMVTHKPVKPKRKDTQVPQLSVPTESVADDTVYKELDGSLVRAATIASSLEAEQDSGAKKPWEIPLLKLGQEARKEIKSRTHKLKRLYKVGLTARVESSRDEQSLGEDASKQGRRIDNIDADEDITLVSVHDDADKEMFDADKNLGGEEVFVEQEVVADKEKINEVTLAQALAELETLKPKVKGVVIQEPSEYPTTTTTIPKQKSQDKGKGIRLKNL